MLTNQTDPEKIALATTILRVSLGVVLLAHVWVKIFVYTVPGTIGFFDSVGIPLAATLAYATMAFELIGGLMLILGVGVKPITLVTVALMLGAIIFVHGGNGWLFANEGGGWEYPAFLALAAIVQYLLGTGAYSITSSSKT